MLDSGDVVVTAGAVRAAQLKVKTGDPASGELLSVTGTGKRVTSDRRHQLLGQHRVPRLNPLRDGRLQPERGRRRQPGTSCRKRPRICPTPQRRPFPQTLPTPQGPRLQSGDGRRRSGKGARLGLGTDDVPQCPEIVSHHPHVRADHAHRVQAPVQRGEPVEDMAGRLSTR